ncbi:MAG: DUF3179 domain-containing protein [Bacteroidota bacterium]
MIIKLTDSKFEILGVLVLALILLLFPSCNQVIDSSSNQPPASDSTGWSVPQDQIYTGALQDQILAIDEPRFASVSEIDFMNPDDLVLLLNINGQIKAYPHKVLNYVEIVNDVVGEEPVAVTFCPLTGSGLAWSRTIGEQVTTFGVSGLIYKNNLIAYDRQTGSRWSQMLSQSIQGPLRGEQPDAIYPLVQLKWEDMKAAFPQIPVLAGRQSAQNNYDSYPYGENFPDDDEAILFPINYEDDRLDRKTLIHGLFYHSATSLVFPIPALPESLNVTTYTHQGEELVIVGSSDMKLAISFFRQLPDGPLLEFTKTEHSLPAIMEDQEGNVWDLFGTAIQGPRKGAQLERPRSYHAYWYAWVDFFGVSPRNPIIGFQ